MASKRCVISLKRQHMAVEEDIEEDLVLSSSVEAQLNKTIMAEKNISLERSVDAEGDIHQTNCEDLVPGQSTSLVNHSREDTIPEDVADVHQPDSPQPGPSRYEDISFEPQVTSTPHHLQEEIAEDVTAQNDDALNDDCDVDGIRTEIRDGKALRAQVEYEFVRDLRQVFRKQSTKHVSKLTERRINVSKRIAQLKKQRKRIDLLLSALANEKEEIDDTLHKFNYFIDNFPL